MKLLHIVSQIRIEESDINVPKPTPPNAATVQDALTFVFGILAAISFLMIVLSGMRYVLSRGNPDGLTKARNGIVYSAIGLVLAMSAFAIVRFVVRSV
jgi:hypothetical protein